MDFAPKSDKTIRQEAIDKFKETCSFYERAASAFAAYHIDANALGRYREGKAQAAQKLIDALVEIGEIDLG